MKRIFLFITLCAFTIGIVGYIFVLPDFNFESVLKAVSNLYFPNPITDFRDILTLGGTLDIWNSADLEWYNYVVAFLAYIGGIFVFPIVLIKDLCLMLSSGLTLILTILGLI